jgi:uncharacterized lipoprotein YddW (UPF0748 family)
MKMNLMKKVKIVKIGAQASLLAMSVCFKHEKACADTRLHKQLRCLLRGAALLFYVQVIKRFFAVKDTAHCKQGCLRSNLYAPIFALQSKKISVFICVHLWLIFLCLTANAQVKAVWVRPFINAGEETRKNPIQGRAAIRAELERIKRANLNTVYLESFWDGYTTYPSKYAPQRPLSIPYGVARKNEAGQNETWDVLKVYIEEGAKLDLKIHAWFHVFHQWNTNLGGLDKSPIFKQYPEWAMLDVNNSPLVTLEAEGEKRDIYKVFMSPSHPQVRKFLRQIVAEIADKYPQLGGIQWDYIRYPLQSSEKPFDYNPLTLAQFKKETKIDAAKISPEKNPREWRIWQDWKTRQVTEVVKELGEVVRKKQPRWEISAAVFPDIEQNLRVKQQDWKTWAQKGYIDALLPMVYSPNFSKVENWAKDFQKELKGTKTRVYPALFIGHFYNEKSKLYDENYLNLETKLKFDGFGVFAAQSLTDDLIERLAKRN